MTVRPVRKLFNQRRHLKTLQSPQASHDESFFLLARETQRQVGWLVSLLLECGDDKLAVVHSCKVDLGFASLQ